jgi:integrase/ribosomal protein L40E
MDSEWLSQKREKRLQRALECEDLLPEQKQTLERLNAYWARKGLSFAARANYVTQAQYLGRFLRKPYERATREDLEAYVSQIAERHHPRSAAQMKLVLKVLYKAMLQPSGRGHPDVVSWIQASRSEKRQNHARELLSPAEVLSLAKAANHPRDRAIIMVLYESAMRAGELVNLRVGDVHFDQYGARLALRGKTGERMVRIIRSVKDLQIWLSDYHPNKDDPDSPLFLSLSKRGPRRPVMHDGLRLALLKARSSAGLKKGVHPHLFRHSRLTELARELSQSELNVFAGWAGDSKMARVYIHLGGDDVDQKLLRNAGLLKQQANNPPDPLAVKICGRCHADNPATSSTCRTCTSPLDEKQARTLADEHEKLAKNLPKLMKILDDPRIKELLSTPPAAAGISG